MPGGRARSWVSPSVQRFTQASVRDRRRRRRRDREGRQGSSAADRRGAGTHRSRLPAAAVRARRPTRAFAPSGDCRLSICSSGPCHCNADALGGPRFLSRELAWAVRRSHHDGARRVRGVRVERSPSVSSPGPGCTRDIRSAAGGASSFIVLPRRGIQPSPPTEPELVLRAPSRRVFLCTERGLPPGEATLRSGETASRTRAQSLSASQFATAKLRVLGAIRHSIAPTAPQPIAGQSSE